MILDRQQNSYSNVEKKRNIFSDEENMFFNCIHRN